MRNVFRVFLPLIAIILFVRYYFTDPPGLQPAEGYPVWLKEGVDKQTQQTSGFSYTGGSGSIRKFISCDDVGKIHRIEIDESGPEALIRITEIVFSEKVKELFSKFKRADLEEIMYDKSTGKILISIEGHEYSSNDPMIYRNKEGIYELSFNKDINTFDTLVDIRRLSLPKEVYEHTFDNIGFEGFSATKSHLYIGLENFQKKDGEFTDSTYLYIVNRNTGGLKTIQTGEFGITSISGLHAVDDKLLYGIDRNRRQLFRIIFDDNHEVISSDKLVLELTVPGHRDIASILGIAPESVTIDGNGSFYIAIDPWAAFYKPDLAQRKLLSEEALFNFRKEVPILYKYNNEFR